jgi:hypothetical protein
MNYSIVHTQKDNVRGYDVIYKKPDGFPEKIGFYRSMVECSFIIEDHKKLMETQLK